MNTFFKYILLLFVMLNLLIFVSGKSWIYRAIYITYLQGYTSSYIHDFIYFPSNKIEDGDHQEWLISNEYNKEKLPEFIKPINDKLGTVAFLVIKNDSILFERYWNGYSADSASNSFSIAKSWIATMVGIALKEGKIKSLDQKVCDFLPEFCNGDNSNITIKNLLTMSAGLDWNEHYYNPLGQTSEAYFSPKLRNQIINLKSVDNPGVLFKYSSACTQILSFIIEEATGLTISDYTSDKLWKVIGANHPALWNTDIEGGDEKAFCCINSNARDLARLGKLYINFGNWNGIQILDSNYIRQATSFSDLLNNQGDKNINYGYHFWLTNYKGFDIYSSKGLHGQYVICIPEISMIVVRLGQNDAAHLDDGHTEDFYQFIDVALKMFN